MDIIVPPSADRQSQPRPSICPECGLAADNGIVVEAELTRTATYVDTAGHIWAVMWPEVS